MSTSVTVPHIIQKAEKSVKSVMTLVNIGSQPREDGTMKKVGCTIIVIRHYIILKIS